MQAVLFILGTGAEKRQFFFLIIIIYTEDITKM